MANVRVYELAKRVGVDSRVVLDKMTELGHFVRSASATIEAPVVRELIDALGVVQETAVSLPRVPSPAAPPAGSVLRPTHHEVGPHVPLEAAGQPFDPRRIGPFEVLGRLGSGRMGRVFLARSASGRRAASRPSGGAGRGPAVPGRFTREVEAARAVSGFYRRPSWTPTRAPPCRGWPPRTSPRPRWRRSSNECGPMPAQAVRWLAAGIAEALQSIHGAGLVHRDLKPSNVLVVEDGPRVIDFGIASGVSNTRLTMTNVAVGTPAYMSPEQAKDSRSVTGASDVFSLGSMLVFAATGHRPYHGRDPVRTMLRMQTEAPDLSGVPEHFVDVAASCLRPDPDGRPGLDELLDRIVRDMEPGPDGLYRPSELLPPAAFEFLGLQDV